MTIEILEIEQKRLISLVEIVYREGVLLQKTDARLFQSTVDAAWVTQLDLNEDLAERLDAFVSRFGRMQDTIGDKLIPSLLRSLAEKPGSALDNLNRAEKLGIVNSAAEWLDVRNLRNKLIHEYLTDAGDFADALNRSHFAVTLLVTTYNTIAQFAQSRLANTSSLKLL